MRRGEWPQEAGHAAEIRLSERDGRSAYDGPVRPAHEVVAETADGHALMRSVTGGLYSARMVDGAPDSHGLRLVVPHVGETERQLMDRWVRACERGEM